MPRAWRSKDPLLRKEFAKNFEEGRGKQKSDLDSLMKKRRGG